MPPVAAAVAEDGGETNFNRFTAAGPQFCSKEKLIFNDISNQALAKISKVMPHWMKVKLSFCYIRDLASS